MLDFPANPTYGQIYASGPFQWKWDGEKWINGYGSSSIVTSVAGKTGDVILVHSDISDWNSAPITYANLPPEVQQVPLAFPIAGLVPPGAFINIIMPWVVTVAANLAGTVAYQGTRTTTNATFIFNKISAATTPLGSVTITSTSPTSAILAGSGGSLAVGDVLQLQAPAVADATLADMCITLLVSRT